MTLSLMGGIIGVTLGWGIAQAIGHVSLGGSNITPVVSLGSVLLATLFSLAVGLFFGIYPAARGLSPAASGSLAIRMKFNPGCHIAVRERKV